MCSRICCCSTSTEKKLTTLGEYVTRMREEQKYIYFASGDTVEAIDHMPQTELAEGAQHGDPLLHRQGRRVLSDILRTYQDKPFRSVTDGDLELPGEEKKDGDNERYKEAFAFIKDALDGAVDEVKVSIRLKTHPVCLSSGEGVTFEMEKYFKAAQPELGLKAKRILEINVDHPAFQAFETARHSDPDRRRSTPASSTTRPSSSPACPSTTPLRTPTCSAPCGNKRDTQINTQKNNPFTFLC